MATDIILLVGPLLIGALLSYFLFGVYAVQLYYYFTNYGATDRKMIIACVHMVTLVETIQLVFSTHTTWENLAKGFSNPEVLATTPWSGVGLPALNAAVALFVQFFFAWRIWSLTKSIWGRLFSGLVAAVALMQFAAGLSVSIQFPYLGLKYERLVMLNNSITVWLAGSFACDLLISVGMVVLLMRRKEATSYENSKNIINMLIAHTIENGLVTTICALAELVAFLRWPEVWIHITFEFILGRLYANVLLATLNGRARLRGGQTSLELTSTTRAAAASRSQYNLKPMSNNAYTTSANQIKSYPVVSVSTEVKVDSDLFSGDGLKAHDSDKSSHASAV